jgi:hypothetical protein
MCKCANANELMGNNKDAVLISTSPLACNRIIQLLLHFKLDTTSWAAERYFLLLLFPD